MSRVMRSVRNVTKGYSGTQIKVREATSNDPWGPTGTQMSEIAQMTFNSGDFYDIVDMLDKRLNDKGKNWRHVLKALKVLDYCLHEGSELVVTWARQSVYIIKTLREFQYIDEDGRDVGNNVRIAAKELTALILDEERLRAERSDRKSWKSRVTGLEEFAPPDAAQSSQQRRERRAPSDDDDAEYKLALEASRHQEEEDRRKREGRGGAGEDDDDLAKALKLSREEDERRRREFEEQNAQSLFDDDLIQTSQPQQTGFNQGYQQGNQVDFFANPVDQNQMQNQQTGFLPNAYTGFPQQPQQHQQTGFPNYNNFQQQQQQLDPYGQQQQHFGMQTQPTGFNPYAQQQQQPLQSNSQDSLHPGSNNPWATNGQQNNNNQSMKPTPTGSNNPFAQNRPGSAKPMMASLGSLPEQKVLANFGQPAQQPAQLQQPHPFGAQPAFNNNQPSANQPNANQPQKPMNEHEARLNQLLASGDGMDTYGNTGDLRIPAQHTAPGTFVNSAGSGANRLNPEMTGHNPYMRQQFTGMPAMNYGQQSNNPFGAQQPQQQHQHQQQQNQDLIQF